ncbi:hypothetical protein HOLleu_15811 [Holothuria leucospilota]|uniref:Uncharacterized protein n=1 Tax=Holothuria leucospilota TaxID=206669 RepID=A0A9Q1C5Q4_HOLLE|nr:hypothetical protein HOLleu_15811 [Holothuria leucospilota]
MPMYIVKYDAIRSMPYFAEYVVSPQISNPKDMQQSTRIFLSEGHDFFLSEFITKVIDERDDSTMRGSIVT